METGIKHISIFFSALSEDTGVTFTPSKLTLSIKVKLCVAADGLSKS